ncbi:MAG: von Willebrand factor type A domain-containing protein, partial [Verrucomicrobiota bacterium]|nr:von Willebrand factor type A domain-containing protein [Verrucomicrobiota bacterium]
MKLSINDPRLTAYALGEIEDPNEHAEISREIAFSPELQAAVAEIRKTGDILSDALMTEIEPALSEFEKARISQCVQPKLVKRMAINLRQHWHLVAGLAAACLAAAVVWLPKLQDPLMEYAYHQAEKNGARRMVVPAPNRIKQLVQNFIPPSADFVPPPPAIQYISPPAVQEFGKVETPNAFIAEPKAFIAEPNAYVAEDRSFDYINERNLRDATGPNTSPAPMVNTYSPQIILREGFNTQMQSSAAFNTESYDPIEETDFRSPLVAPLSTFSIDVDTASYANVRRFLQQGQLPPNDAVRIEELINYFSYGDTPPTKSLEGGGDPFAVHMTQATAPWNAEHQLLRIALKGYEMPWEERPASNLVFLLDVSGSMSAANKLPLVKTAMDMLIRRLGERDKVAIVVYAGASGLVLPSITANNYETIAHALKNLHASGSTNGGAGIELAYKTAREHFIEGGNNRVILCTDGDFNIGQTSRSSLAKKAEVAADDGISLSVLGFGMHNYKDDMLETLSNKGKGSYAYIDSSAEARKVFLKDLTGNLFKI